MFLPDERGNLTMGKSLKGKELGKGVTQRKDGSYQARFTNRFGKRETIYAKTVTEITRKMREEQFKDEKQINLVDNDITLDEWFDIWMDIHKKNCRNSTKRTYEINYNRLRESLGWRKLSTLNLLTLQKVFNDLPSDTSRKSSKTVLVDMLNKAQEANLVLKNIANQINVVIDNIQREEKRILTQQEIDILLESSRDNRLYPIFVVALNTGMRIGEILGLTWDCVDFEKNMISVTKTLSYLSNDGKGHYEFHPTKTTAGKRRIPMGIGVKSVLENQKSIRQEMDHYILPKKGFEGLVFTSSFNNPLNAMNIKDSINCLVKRINKENPDIGFKHFTPHTLRHTFASNCIANGMNPKTLQRILGHSSLQMTMDLYCHVLDETIAKEMSSISEMV